MNKIIQSTKNLASKLEKLDGCMDVIVVREKTGGLSSTPFYVRFGLVNGVTGLISGDQLVNIEINGRILENITMLLDRNGVAFFNHECCSEVPEKPKEDFDKQKIKPLGTKIMNVSSSEHRNLKGYQKKVEVFEDFIKDVKIDVDQKATFEKRNNPEALKSSQSESNTDLIWSKQNRVNLTSSELKQLQLQPGVNEIRYLIKNSTQKCHIAQIYLWNYSDKLVVVDVDGTITKSNFRGQILSVFGLWYHENIVDLFQCIEQMGFRILYLSARPICMFDITRYLIRDLSQNNRKLPFGAILLQPVTFLDALQMELIDKRSDEFKISCMEKIKGLFENNLNPFYAGFGNNLMDVNCYKKVGISASLVFIVNQMGEVYVNDNIKLSFKKLIEQIDKYFPSSLNDSHVDELR